MIRNIENINTDYIELNLININKNSENYNYFIKKNQSNHILKKILNQFIHKYNKNLNTILNEYIYILNSHSNYLQQIVESEKDNKLYNFIKDNVKKSEKKENKLTLIIKCYGDINNIIKLFDETIEQTNIKDINIIQSKISEYIVSSNYNLDNFTIFLKYNDINLI